MGQYTVDVSSKARKELQLHYRSGKKMTSGRLSRFFLNYLRLHMKEQEILSHVSISCSDTGQDELTRRIE
jgi:hypothetical protein